MWADAFHFWSLHRQEFDEHYHKRSNIKSTVWMIKSRFGGHVWCKTETAMKNKVYFKVLYHNICCLIQSVYELGIEPEFLCAGQPEGEGR